MRTLACLLALGLIIAHTEAQPGNKGMSKGMKGANNVDSIDPGDREVASGDGAVEPDDREDGSGDRNSANIGEGGSKAFGSKGKKGDKGSAGKLGFSSTGRSASSSNGQSALAASAGIILIAAVAAVTVRKSRKTSGYKEVLGVDGEVPAPTKDFEYAVNGASERTPLVVTL